MKNDTFYRSNKMTAPLEYYIQDCENFEEFERKFSDELLNDNRQVGYYLDQLLTKYGKKISVVSKDAHQAMGYLGNIINGKKNNPSRNSLICFCFTLGATVEETQYLLKYAGKAPLYVRRKRDVIIWFGLMKNEDLDTVNMNLLDRNLEPLYKE